MVSNADVPPGGEGKIEVKVSTKGRSGKLTKSITVETDDPVQPIMKLKVSANVIVDLDFERPYMRFDRGRSRYSRKNREKYASEK